MKKRIKKSLALTLTAAITLATTLAPVSVSAASYSDVKGKSCETAVNVLSGLGVVNGYLEDGKSIFKPDNTVTRAEMAKLLVAAMGKTSQATSTSTGFTDVPDSHWSASYVAYASAKSIINGYGGGKFGPSDTVTYAQAEKMIVGALGYTNECTEMTAGAWDTVYPAKAAELGITNGISGSGNAGATRGDCAIMLYNALSAANVYADLEGNATLMPGTSEVTFKGETTTGLTWLSTLLSTGGARYVVIDQTYSSKASVDVSDYIGQAAMVFMNDRSSIIACLGSNTVLMKGSISSDGKTFTSEGKTYTIGSAALKTFASVDDGTVIDADCVPYLFCGTMSSVRSANGKYSGEVIKMNNGTLQIVNSSTTADPVTVTGTCTITAKLVDGALTEIWAVNKNASFSGRTTAYETSSATHPVLYWTVNSIKAGDSIDLTLTATEAGSIGYIIDQTPGVHVSDTPYTVKQGENHFTVNLKNAEMTTGQSGYLHIGFTGTSGAHMVAHIAFTNTTATYK